MVTTATRNNKSGFSIGVGCPGCGGEVTLEDDFFVLACRHCGSVLRLEMPDMPPAYMVSATADRRELRFGIDRYQKEHDLPLTRSDLQIKPIYYPYWRIEGILLKVRNRVEERVYTTTESEGAQVEHRVETPKTHINLTPYVTTIQAGPEVAGVPATIGYRATWLKLVPYARENTQDGFTSLAIARRWEDVNRDLTKRVEGVGGIDPADFGNNLTRIYRPRPSLVFYPYIIAESYRPGDYDRWLIDGISGRVLVHQDMPENPDCAGAEELPEVPFGQLKVDFHRCAQCGSDLPETPSCVYICKQCDYLNVMQEAREAVHSVFTAENSDGHPSFPFWIMHFSSDADPRLKKLVGGIRESSLLAIPAFRASGFDGLYRLARRLSTAAEHFSVHELVHSDQEFHPAAIGPAEAMVLAEVVVTRALVEQGVRVEQVSLPVDDLKLAYLPFEPQSYFYVDTNLGAVTFERGLLR